MTAGFDICSITSYIRVMKPWGRFIFIFFAYGLTLLHTAVPHHHSDTTGKGETLLTHAGCIFEQTSGGLLQRALSTDLGLGHLETFKKGTDTEIECTHSALSLPAIIAQDPAIPEKILFRVFGHGSIEKFRKRLLLFSTAHLRAPPHLS